VSFSAVVVVVLLVRAVSVQLQMAGALHLWLLARVPAAERVAQQAIAVSVLVLLAVSWSSSQPVFSLAKLVRLGARSVRPVQSAVWAV
jgi:hypothetical protein